MLKNYDLKMSIIIVDKKVKIVIVHDKVPFVVFNCRNAYKICIQMYTIAVSCNFTYKSCQ